MEVTGARRPAWRRANLITALRPDQCSVAPWSPKLGDAHDCVLFFAETRLVGFALALCDGEGTWHVEEMFVVALSARHPGRWTLAVRPDNPRALAFWTRLLSIASVPELGADGITRSRFTFDAVATRFGERAR